MKMDYASSSSEKRAHDLLAPLVGACPDSVWEVLNVELEARRLKARSNWLNNISISPKVPLMVAGAIAIIVLSVWGITSLKQAKHTNEVVTNVNPVKQVSVQQVNTNSNNNKVVVQSATLVQPVAKPVTDNSTNNNKQDNSTALVKADKHKKHIDSIAVAPVAQGEMISIKQNDNSTLDMHTVGDADATIAPVKTRKADSATSSTVNQPSAETVVASDEQ